MGRLSTIGYLLLSGCQMLPLDPGGPVRQQTAVNVYPIPLCLFGCNATITAIRETVDAAGNVAPITTGAKSTTNTTTAQGGSRQ